MGKKFKTKTYSVRGSSDYIDVKIFSDGKIIFKGGCNPRDPNKVSQLFKLLKSKGIIVTKKDDSWW